MKKGLKIAHSSTCKGGLCRGGCCEQSADEIRSFSIDKSQIGRKKDNIFISTGQAKTGKSDAAMQYAFGNKMLHDFQFKVDNPMYEAYKKGKEERIASLTDDRRNYWETLGRLLGMAYAESDTAFFALLEGMYRGRLNELRGTRALGAKS